jgi:hypothetical protein
VRNRELKKVDKSIKFWICLLFIFVGCGGLLGNDFTFLTTDL